MQHDHVLKLLNFDLLTSFPRVDGGGGMQSKYLVLCCCNCDSLKFDMQHDRVLKKWNIDLLTLSPGSGR